MLRAARLWVPITSAVRSCTVPLRRLSAATPPPPPPPLSAAALAELRSRHNPLEDDAIGGPAGGDEPSPMFPRPPPPPSEWRPPAQSSEWVPPEVADSGEVDGKGAGIDAPKDFKDMFGGATVPDGQGVGGVGNIVDVQGGTLKNEEQEEGQLYTAERAKNVIVASRRFQLATYNSLPGTKSSYDSLHSDPLCPVRGAYHPESNSVAVLLRPSNRSELQHITNVAQLASASVAAGHIDPPPLIPVFTRIGLIPPTVRPLLQPPIPHDGSPPPRPPRTMEDTNTSLFAGAHRRRPGGAPSSAGRRPPRGAPERAGPERRPRRRALPVGVWRRGATHTLHPSHSVRMMYFQQTSARYRAEESEQWLQRHF